jgi:hypothetical protein
LLFFRATGAGDSGRLISSAGNKGLSPVLFIFDPVTPVTDFLIEIDVAGEFQPCNEAIPRQEL